MKKIILWVALAVSSVALSQTVTITESDMVVNKINRTGLGTILELDDNDVEKLWKKELKEFGSTGKEGKFIYLEHAEMPSLTSKKVRVYSSVEKSGKGVLVWVAVDLGDAWVTKSHPKYSSLEKILRDFAVKAYTEDINEQIEDAEDALNKTTKDYEKEVKEGEKLVDDLKDNAEEKTRLQQELEDNAKNKVDLEKDIEQNKKDQAAGQQEVEKMKKALELVKSKLTQIR